MIAQPVKSAVESASADAPVEIGGSLPFWAVYKRELGVYFRSPIAYAVAFGVLLFLGVLFTSYIIAANGQAPASTQQMPGLLTFLMFLIAPLLTMRLIAEETREGTIETLMTLPMGEGSFILGKFLAAWTYYTILLLLTLVHVAIMAMIGVPDWGITIGAYIGAWLYGGTCIAVCMIWSAITEDQIVAAFLGAATILVLYLAEQFSISLREQPNLAGVGDFVRELGLRAHYEVTLINGIIRPEDVLYFLFMIIGSLFIATRIVETRRWRS